MNNGHDERHRRTEEGDRRLREMRDRRDALNARILKAVNRKRKDEYRQETRRKILMGAWAFEQAMKDNDFSNTVMTGLAQFLVRDSDRALFGLPPLEKAETQSR